MTDNRHQPTLGLKEGQLTPLSHKPNGVSTQTEQTEKQVPPLAFKTDLATTKAAVTQAIEAFGSETQIITDEVHYLRLVFITPVMRFRDDAEFYFDTAKGEVHFRSQSRVGHSDLGLNRQRYDAIASHYREQ